MKFKEFSQNGLVLHLKMDEGTGTTAKDSSPEGNDGTISGATWTYDSEKFMALKFDGSDDYVRVLNDTSINFGSSTDFTIEVWISATSPGTIIHKNYPASLSYCVYAHTTTEAGYVYMRDATTTVDTLVIDTDIIDSGWHHIAVTFDRVGYATGYLDGSKKLEKDISTIGDISNTADMYIGYSGIALLAGKLKDLRIYNRLLSETEIKRHYARGKYILPRRFA